MKVILADLGSDHLPALAKALTEAGAEVDVNTKAADWLDAGILVLASPRSFRGGMDALRPIHEGLRSKLYSGAPCLAIGRGLHLLLERSDEAPVEGLGYVGGDVKRFPASAGGAHVGLGAVRSTNELFEGIPSGSQFHFDHAWYPDPEEEVGIAESQHGVSFVSALRKANTVATQFHPQESGDVGLRFLRNFLAFAAERL